MTTHPEHIPKTLGALIRQARERAGFSLRNLEAIAGISRTMLHRLECNQISHPGADTLFRLADALELNSDDLLMLMGYHPRASLPSLTPYLRAKYQLPPHALAEAMHALHRILEKYDHGRNTDTKSG
jgi:transcriptional regulator with XRE-family HTH domain